MLSRLALRVLPSQPLLFRCVRLPQVARGFAVLASQRFATAALVTTHPRISSTAIRLKSNNRDKKEEKSTGPPPDIPGITSNIGRRMQTALDSLLKEFTNIRAGMPTNTLLDAVMVPQGSSKVPLTRVAQVGVRDGNMLIVSVLDTSVPVTAVENAIRAFMPALNPTNDGVLIKVPIPKMTADHRKEMVKQAAKIAENFKVQVRAARQDANRSIKNVETSQGKDEAKRLEKKIQALHDDFVKKISDAFTAKEKEILR
eukprot:TRINITY_DN6669_c0_g1_i1.p1 TRINITY_DN6669_c0_g1~~TRINITY_DN6669_c0_g1_i1.p1  ORF type:complete len:257 (-),score=80.75 TRINITY_DN6669_c0_g1_i1:47-817(-)